MRKKVLATLLAGVLFILTLPVLPQTQTVQAANIVTPAQIKQKIDKYRNDLGLTESNKYFWNAGVAEATLTKHIADYISTGDISHIKKHLTYKPCLGRGSKTHSREVTIGSEKGCTSNEMTNSKRRTQCYGFAHYMEYYLFGQTSYNNPDNFETFTLKSADDLQIGDHVRNGIHSFIYYGVDKKTKEIIVIQANGSSSTTPCGLSFGRQYNPNDKYYTTDNIAGVTVNRYKHTCAHPNITFNNDTSVICADCKKNLAQPAVSGSAAYMDIVKVNSSGTAPSHKSPYGASTIGVRYTKGDTVYVVGSAKNGYQNLWYKLSDGSWLTADYLGAHKHTKVNGHCTHCFDNLTLVQMNNTTLSAAKSGKIPVHVAPYGASPTFKTVSGSVTVNGKTINGYKNVWYRLANGGWVFTDYLKTPMGIGIVKISGDTLALNDKAASSNAKKSNKLADLTNGTTVYIYTAEKANGYYSIRVDDKVGYAHSTFITVTDASKAVSAPKSYAEPGLSVSDALDALPNETPTTPTKPVTPSSTAVSVLYPTDATYLAKFAVSQTNAVVVANVRKPSGTKVTACGLQLYDANGSLIKDHKESISNVSATNTNFHTWYDINKELGVQLSAGTTYKYRFYAVVDDKTYHGETYSFTTTPPVKEDVKEEVKPEVVPEEKPTEPEEPTETIPEEKEEVQEEVYYTLTFDPNGGECDTADKSVKFDTLIGEMPVAVRDGYTFLGWYGAADGGNLIHEQMRYNAPFDVTVYAHWEKIETKDRIHMWIGKPNLEVNGKPKAIDAQGTVPLLKNGRTLVPIRAIVESMGGEVSWDDYLRCVTITCGGDTVKIYIGTNYAFVNGEITKLDVPPELIGGRTMVPVRFVAENLNATVEWDETTSQITITY